MSVNRIYFFIKYFQFEYKEPHIYLIKNNPEFEQHEGIKLKATKPPSPENVSIFFSS